MTLSLTPIGLIRSPFTQREGMPIQPPGAAGVAGSLEIFEEYAPGLADLEGFSHLILLYHFHLSQGFSLKVKPFMDEKTRGLFATRAPKRPNPIGLSVVRLLGVEGARVLIENVDVLDQTPLLDIKPFVPEFDAPEGACAGWLEKPRKTVSGKRSDGRFI